MGLTKNHNTVYGLGSLPSIQLGSEAHGLSTAGSSAATSGYCSFELVSREPSVGVWNRSSRSESFPKSMASSLSIQLGSGTRGPSTIESSAATGGYYSSELMSREPSVGI